MALDHLEGATYGPIRTTISRAKVAEYLAASRCAEPERWTDTAPPAYAGALLFVVAPEFLASDAVAGHTAVLIHADQTFTWHRPIRIDDDVDVTGRIDRARSRGGVDFVTFSATVATQDGDAVLDSVSTFLLGAEATGDQPEPHPEPPVDRRAGWDSTRAWDGSRIQATARSASRLDLVRYAAASCDFNPIHFDHDAAVAAGLAGTVVHGLLMAAWMLDVATSLVPGDRPIERTRIRFREPLYPGEPARLAGAIRDSRREVEIGLTSAADDRQLVSALVHLPHSIPVVAE